MTKPVTIRRYRPGDGAALAAIRDRTAALPGQGALFEPSNLARPAAAEGDIWLAEEAGQVVAYASLQPVPGLPGVADLSGAVVAGRRRQGVGSRLLRQIQSVLADNPTVRQLSCCLSDMSSPAGHFLKHHQFTLEHEESLLARPDLDSLPPVPGDASVKTYPRLRAIELFHRLYEQSFSPHPWYQPYGPGEIAATLADASDILFVVKDDIAVGFAWLQQTGAHTGGVEPLGIIPPYQGQGLGRRLLLAALHRLRTRGVRAAAIGAWRQNRAALDLYRSLGFVHNETRYYLARDV